jgi:hypothetical protein
MPSRRWPFWRCGNATYASRIPAHFWLIVTTRLTATVYLFGIGKFPVRTSMDIFPPTGRIRLQFRRTARLLADSEQGLLYGNVAERRKPTGPRFVAARRKPSGLSASFRARPGGLRRSATSVRHNSGAIGRKPPGETWGNRQSTGRFTPFRYYSAPRFG